MSYNVSNLTPFVDQTKMDLINKAVVGNPSFAFLNLVAGIEYKTKLNLVSNSITVQTGGCGFNPLGTVTLYNREIEVKPLKINDTVCNDTLEQYFMQAKMAGNPDNFDLAPAIADSYVKNIATNNEFQVWQGNFTGSTSAITYDMIDGFLKIISNEPTRKRVTALVSGSTLSTIIADIELMYSNVPEEIRTREDLYLYLSPAEWNKYRNALSIANLFHFDATKVDGRIIEYIPGLKVISTPGLTGIYSVAGLPCWVLSYQENMIVGTDMLNNYETLFVEYAQTLQATMVVAKWKLGVEFYFPEFVVTNF